MLAFEASSPITFPNGLGALTETLEGTITVPSRD